MQLRIRARDIDFTPEIDAAIERRSRLALGRHAAGIAVTHLTLSASRNDRTDSTLRCRASARLLGGESHAVEVEGDELVGTAAAAAARLAHQIERRRALLSAAPRRPRAGGPLIERRSRSH